MNEKLGDGGPAFPVPEEHGQQMQPDGKWEQRWIGSSPGMSLRDWFAGMALNAIAGPYSSEHRIQYCGDLAYKLADAMLKARSQ